MFTHHCTACDKRQLIFLSQAKAVVGTEAGPAVTFTCWCGAEQTAVTTLGDAEPADNPHVLAA
jgi:hypothetical protein